MPIKIPNELPAAKVLTDENIFIMTETRAITQDIRALKILLLNLMPTKIDTETQLSRLLGNTALQIELELIHTRSHESKNTPEDHLLAFYKTFDEVKEQNWDGLIITGAPIEQMEFEEVNYWDEITSIFDWARTHVTSTLNIGTSWWKSWNGAKPMSTAPSISAGAHRQVCIIITASKST